jgi:excisionase family DNA binding protein
LNPQAEKMKQDRLLKIDEVAEILRLSPRTVRRMAAQAQFRVLKVGNRPLRIWRSSVFDYLERVESLWSEDNGVSEDFEGEI